MTKEQLHQKLEALKFAGDTIVGLLKDLNTDQFDCESCGCAVQDSWPETKVHNALTGAIGRVERAGALLWQEYGDGRRFPLKGRWAEYGVGKPLRQAK